MHYYQFNIGDYASHTRHLTQTEDLGYRRLLDHYYLTEKPLELDAKKLARLIGMRDNAGEIEQVLADFFVKTDDGYTQNRVSEEIAKYHSKADAARANGKKGGRPHKPKITQSVNLANPAKSGSEAKQETLTTKQETVTIDKPLVAAEPQRAKVKYSIEDMQSAEYMFSTLVAKQPEMKKPNLESWAGEVRKMREIDKLDMTQMGEVWQWARNDSFWASNILSAKKFREKYQQLLARMRQPQSTGYQSTNEKNAARMAEVRNLDTARNF